MKNQTVEQIFTERKMTMEGGVPKDVAQEAIATPEQKEATKIVNSITQALQQAQRSVRQAELSNPMNPHLSQVNTLLSHSMQQLKQLETVKLSISNGTKVQLKQLDNQIETASGTLSMIKQAIGASN